jgi:hypothetical protein
VANRWQHFWGMFSPTPGSIPRWARHVAASMGFATLLCVLIVYVRHAWDIEQISDAFVYWTGIITALGVFALRAARQEDPPQEKKDVATRD